MFHKMKRWLKRIALLIFATGIISIFADIEGITASLFALDTLLLLLYQDVSTAHTKLHNSYFGEITDLTPLSIWKIDLKSLKATKRN